jgi:hypothetical protein
MIVMEWNDSISNQEYVLCNKKQQAQEFEEILFL